MNVLLATRETILNHQQLQKCKVYQVYFLQPEKP